MQFNRQYFTYYIYYYHHYFYAKLQVLIGSNKPNTPRLNPWGLLMARETKPIHVISCHRLGAK